MPYRIRAERALAADRDRYHAVVERRDPPPDGEWHAVYRCCHRHKHDGVRHCPDAGEAIRRGL